MQPKLTYIDCPYCQKNIEVKRKMKFRCPECKAKLQRPKKTLKCKFCKRMFESYLYIGSNSNNQQFCSTNCRVKNWQRNKKSPEELLKRKLLNKLSNLSNEQLGQLLLENKNVQTKD